MLADKRLEDKRTFRLDSTLKLISEFTGLSDFTPTPEGGAQLIIHQDILKIIKKQCIDASAEAKELKTLAESILEYPNPDNEKLLSMVIPNIAKYQNILIQLLPKLSKIQADSWEKNYKKFLIMNRYILSLMTKYDSSIQTLPLTDLKEIADNLLFEILKVFQIIEDLLFSKALNSSRIKVILDTFPTWFDSYNSFFFTINQKSDTIAADYADMIFIYLMKLHKKISLVNKTLKISSFPEISKLILKHINKIYFSSDIDNKIGESYLLEYYDIISQVETNKFEKLIEEIALHGLCFMHCMKERNTRKQLFHYRFITDGKNIQQLLERPNPSRWMEIDKLVGGVGFASTGMWERLINTEALTKEVVTAEIKKFQKFLEKYILRRSAQIKGMIGKNGGPEILGYIKMSQNFDSDFKNLLTNLQEFLIKINPPENKEKSIKLKKPRPPVKSGAKTSSIAEYLSPPLPSTVPEIKGSLLALPPPLPTLHKSPDECDADQQLKNKKLTQKKSSPPISPSIEKAKIYEITSKLGHLIYGVLSLPPGTSSAITQTAIQILEKGRIGTLNNQIKFVSNDEIKKMCLPTSAHYKIKGKISTGESKGQLVRIYGVPNASNIVNFSILVHKPHKSDSINFIKVII